MLVFVVQGTNVVAYHFASWVSSRFSSIPRFFTPDAVPLTLLLQELDQTVTVDVGWDFKLLWWKYGWRVYDSLFVDAS